MLNISTIQKDLYGWRFEIAFGFPLKYSLKDESRNDGVRQLMDFASEDVFQLGCERHGGVCRVYQLTYWKQFLCMAFGQITHGESRRDTALSLNLQKGKLNLHGIGVPFKKSTISPSNETRDFRIFSEFAS